MFLIIPSPTIAQMVMLRRKWVGRAIDKIYPKPLVQNQNSFTEMVLMLPSAKIDQKFSLAEQHGYQS